MWITILLGFRRLITSILLFYENYKQLSYVKESEK